MGRARVKGHGYWTLAAVVTVVLIGLRGGGWERAALAGPLDPRGDNWEGLSQLVRMAQAEVGVARVRVPQKLDLDALGPKDAVVLIHPTGAFDGEEVAAFMRAGGRVVLLDDFGRGDTLLAHFGIKRVPLPSHPAEALRGNPAFAVADSVSAHEAVRDVARVVTNHATGLADTGLLPLLVVRGRNEPDVLLAVAGVVGKGRFLAVGDASVVMNAMLKYPGNHALGNALIRYATEDSGSTAGGGKLFVVANDTAIVGRFASASESALQRALGSARRTGREVLEGLKLGCSPLATYVMALAVGVGVVIWASTHAGRTHKALTPRFARPIALVAQGGVAGHAAVLAAPGTSRVLALLEVKSALEEQLVARLGVERPLRSDELVAKARGANLIDDAEAHALGRLFTTLARFENILVRKKTLVRVRDVKFAALASEAQRLLAAIDGSDRVRVTQRT